MVKPPWGLGVVVSLTYQKVRVEGVAPSEKKKKKVEFKKLLFFFFQGRP